MYRDPETMDYCTECMCASEWLCPNPNCHSRSIRWPDPRQRLEPQDYLNARTGRREFACASEELLRKGARGAAHAIAEAERRLLKGDIIDSLGFTRVSKSLLTRCVVHPSILAGQGWQVCVPGGVPL